MLKSSWDDTFVSLVFFTTLHSMCFSSSCLTICEDSSVVTLQSTFNDGQSSLFEYSFLLAVWLESHIEAENSLFLSSFFGTMNDNFTSFGYDIDD